MKVLQINAVYGYGSTGMIVQGIHTMLQSGGIESYVAYSLPFDGENEERYKDFYKIGSAFDRKIHALLSRIGGKQGYFSYFATKGLLRYIEKIRPDVVHLHNVHNNYVNVPLLCNFLRKNDIATVVTLHDCWYYTGGCYHYSAVKCKKWLCECGDCVKRFEDTPAYLVDSSKQILRDRNKFFNAIKRFAAVGVSKWISGEAGNSLLRNKKVYTVYNGIDTDFFSPVNETFRERFDLKNKFVILGFANKWLMPENRELMERLRALCGEDTAFIIAGCSARKAQSLPEGIIPVEYISDRSVLRELYSSCDVFVNCTHEESLSMVNVEAQACGTPVVTYSATGAGETVDGISGFGIEADDVQGFVDKVQQIRSRGKKEYSEACRSFVLSRFNERVNYSDYLAIYKEVSEFENKNR